MTNSLYCSEPFKQIHFDSRGNLGPCCQYIGKRDEEVNSIDEYLQSSFLQTLKDSLSKGEKVSGCDFCWKQEDSGTESMRQKRVKYYSNRGFENDTIEHIMITFGNQCNTACRICNASRSSLVEKQYKESLNTCSDPELVKLITKNHDWSKSKNWYKNIIDGIVERSGKIRKLEISGGEPFINHYYNKLIDKIQNTPQTLPQISVTTNGSFSEEQIDRLQMFNHCHINFSVDGVGRKYYEYLRWPLKWDDFLDKVEILKRKEWLTCEFVIVPHNLNISNLAETIEYLKVATNFDSRFKIGFSWLNGAPWYKLDNSPVAVRKTAIDELELLLTKYVFSDQEKNQILDLINILRNSNSPSHLNMFSNHVKLTDNYRGCDTFDILGWNINDIV